MVSRRYRRLAALPTAIEPAFCRSIVPRRSHLNDILLFLSLPYRLLESENRRRHRADGALHHRTPPVRMRAESVSVDVIDAKTLADQPLSERTLPHPLLATLTFGNIGAVAVRLRTGKRGSVRFKIIAKSARLRSKIEAIASVRRRFGRRFCIANSPDCCRI